MNKITIPITVALIVLWLIAMGLVFSSRANATCGMFWACNDIGCLPNPVCDTPDEPLPPDLKATREPPIIRVPPEPTAHFKQYQDGRFCRRVYICNNYRNCGWEILCR